MVVVTALLFKAEKVRSDILTASKNQEPDRSWWSLCELAGRGLAAFGTFIVVFSAAFRTGVSNPSTTPLWLGAAIFGIGAVLACIGASADIALPRPSHRRDAGQE